MLCLEHVIQQLGRPVLCGLEAARFGGELMFLPKTSEIYTAPLNEDSVEACRKTSCGIKKADVHLNRTLPSLLDEGCDFDQSGLAERSLFSAKWPFYKRESLPASINHYDNGQWRSWTLAELRRIAEELALALQQYEGVEKGDRAALLMDSNAAFVMADIGCLLAQLVTVPMLPEQPISTTEYMLTETGASMLFVSRLKQVKKLLSKASNIANIRLIVIAKEVGDNRSEVNFRESIRALQWSLPNAVELVALSELRAQASWSKTKAQRLRAELDAHQLATIVYTLGEEGRPLGAMLTHENLSGSALAAFSTLPCLRKGSREIALSFLPLHHIFARGFVYGSLSFGQSLYFSTPRRVMKHLQALKPTVFFTVPRLLEKVYEGWLATVFSSNSFQAHPASKLRHIALLWAWRVANSYRVNEAQSIGYRIQLWAARQTVLRPLKNLFGDQMQCFISGGAALPAEVMTLLLAAGLKLCQGYGLTEASSTLSFTRRHWSQTGTVGVPMPGVELTLAADGEVMVKAPYVMQGYYHNPAATRAVLEKNGWLHTGDRGKFSAEGLLTLTGHKKALFKLSIGEYVAPLPIEQSLQKSPLIDRALVVGPGRKFCGLLIFTNTTALAAQAKKIGVDLSNRPLQAQPQVVLLYQSLVDGINTSLPFWSTVKRFQLIDADSLETDNETHISPVALDRDALSSVFSDDIEKLYQPAQQKRLAPKPTAQSLLSIIYQLSMLIPSVLSLKKMSVKRERPNHV